MERKAQDVSDGGTLLDEPFPKVGNGSPNRKENNGSKPSSPQKQRDGSPVEQRDGRLESARAEMGEVREENERLKMYLERVMKDYKTLQMQFLDIVKQQPEQYKSGSEALEAEESELISLSLGNSSSKKDEKSKAASTSEDMDRKVGEDQEGLALSLDCKFETSAKSRTTESLPNNMSPENSFEDQKEEAGEIWPPSKVLKNVTSGGDNDEVSQQNPAKKARVCVRARCDTPTMNDGCQWRKYGQKIAKGNPCPRAYYRCTVAPSCPVRKQVQRCADDMSILITTYEGTHNHPLPVSATAMASTTSAAASMLLSGSTTSGSSQGPPMTATTDLHGLSFYLSDPTRSKQFYLPNSSPISPSPSHPTITLDLTSSPPVSSSASSYLSRFAPATNYNSIARYNSATSLSFGSSEPVSWGAGLPNYSSTSMTPSHQLFNKSGLPMVSYLQKPNNNPPQDSIAAATKAITTDPNFQSALAAALKSIISGGASTGGATVPTPGNHQGGVGVDVFSQKLTRWNESRTTAPVGSMFGPTATPQVNTCGSSYLNKSGPSTNAHHVQPAASLMFLQPNSMSSPFSSSKHNAAAATSPVDNRDRNSL